MEKDDEKQLVRISRLLEDDEDNTNAEMDVKRGKVTLESSQEFKVLRFLGPRPEEVSSGGRVDVVRPLPKKSGPLIYFRNFALALIFVAAVLFLMDLEVEEQVYY